MRFFTKNRSSKKRIIEEWVYEQVADELGNGEIRKGLWTKARGLSEGDTNKCESIYYSLEPNRLLMKLRFLMKPVNWLLGMKRKELQNQRRNNKCRLRKLKKNRSQMLGNLNCYYLFTMKITTRYMV